MFKLGGPARVDFNTGGLGEIEELIKKRAALRDQTLDSVSSLLPLQVLANQPGLSTIRSPRDVLNILSGLGTDPNTFGALSKLKQVDLKKNRRRIG